MVEKINVHQFWKGAFILSISGLITKILSAGYRIPYQNIAGDVGFYIYQQVYPFYGIALILGTYGFPVIISKMIAESKDNNQASHVMLVSFASLIFICFSLFFITYFGSEKIALLMGDPQLHSPIRVVAFTFLFTPFISIFRGYFQGNNNMVPTAISQIFEQLFRVGSILIFSYILLTAGYDVYIAGAGAVFGSIIGGFISILFLFFFWYREKIRLPFESIQVEQISLITKMLVIHGITVCASHLIFILFQFVDAFTIYSILLENGMNQWDAKVMKGIFDRGQPLLQMGTILTTSISLVLIPMIAIAINKDNDTLVKEKIDLSIRLSIVIGLGATLGLILIMKETNIMLYTNADGTMELSILAISIFFSSIVLTTSAILQGVGLLYTPAIAVLFGIFVKFMCNLLLIPFFDIVGAAIATVIAFISIVVINLFVLKRKVNIDLNYGYFYRGITKASIMMVVGLVVYQLLMESIIASPSRIASSTQAISSVLIGASIYLYFVLKNGAFSRREISSLPYGEKLIFIIKDKVK